MLTRGARATKSSIFLILHIVMRLMVGVRARGLKLQRCLSSSSSVLCMPRLGGAHLEIQWEGTVLVLGSTWPDTEKNFGWIDGPLRKRLTIYEVALCLFDF